MRESGYYWVRLKNIDRWLPLEWLEPAKEWYNGGRRLKDIGAIQFEIEEIDERRIVRESGYDAIKREYENMELVPGQSLIINGELVTIPDK